MFNWKTLVLLLVAALLFLGGVAAFSYFYNTLKVVTGEPACEFSFEPFTVEQLLSGDLTVDLETSGEIVETEELDTLQKNVSELRGLPIKEPIKFREVSEELVAYTMIKEFEEEEGGEELLADQKLLVALGLFPKGGSLEKTLTDLYTEQIAGFYDPETKDITLVKGKDTGDVMDELTLAHETTHALQDQNFGLEDPPLEEESYNGDNNLGVTSLVEGDATLTMVLYARRYIPPEKLTPEALEGDEESSKVLDAAPPYIRKSLLFPYEQGLTFAQAAYEKGEYPQIDDALRAPPLSSEQILHPELFLGPDKQFPTPVPLADISGILGSGWKKINEDCLGEFDYQAWFEQYGGTAGAKEASEGWAGNTIQYYQGPGTRYSLVSETVWDAGKDALDFFELYVELLADRFKGREKKTGGGSDWYLYRADGQLFYCGIAGDRTLALQATSREDLVNTLKSFPGFPQLP